MRLAGALPIIEARASISGKRGGGRMFDLKRDDVPEGGYWSNLKRMDGLDPYGEPFFMLQIGEIIGQWLIDNGLVEEVTERPWPSPKPCYRLTKLGKAVIKRGKYAKGPAAEPPQG